MQEVTDSRQQTEQEKKELRSEEADILKQIVNSESTYQSKFDKWVQILDRRRELLDVDFAIDQTSTYMRGILGELPIAANVNHYLADKYKDANMMRFGSVDKKLKQLQNCSTTYCERI